MWLKLKIFIGYITLVILLIFIVYSFQQSLVKHSRIQQKEREMVRVHHLAGKTYAGLLELSTLGETVSVWNREDLFAYRDKRKEICGNLQELKPHMHSAAGQSRIDSLCLLLESKEQLLDTVMKTFDRLQEVDEIVSRKIPAIASHVQKTAETDQIVPEINIQNTKSEKRSLWSKLFRKKEEKSAYQEHRKKMEEENKRKRQKASASGMLYSLNREISEHQASEKEKLLLQMDNLYRNNTKLNQRLHSIVKDLEQEVDRRIENRYRQFIAGRNQSFHTLSTLAIFISLLTILLYIIIHRDLKRKYRYEKELESSDLRNKEILQSRQNMMLAIAHDLRSPLGTIKGAAELLPDESRPESRKEYAESISHASDYMLSLVDTLMKFYLLDTDQVQAHVSFFHLESLFREIVDGCLLQARKKELRFSCDLSGMDTVVRGDKGRLQQIVNNLLSNALKFTDRGSIRLKAEYRSDELRFSVQDTGCGMNREETERIFTAFERLENARDIPGFGLGLTISYRLVALMKGTIRVESRPGEGSTFIVTLPLTMADGKLQTEKENSETSIRLDGVSALLLDDDIRQLHITREMLKRSGACCDICTNSRELISKMRENSYDVLLTDIQMPEMDGFAILELLRASNIGQAKTIPVIALTARVDEERHYLSRGFAGCIRKPFTKESLSNGIAEVIGSRDRREWEPDFSLLFAGEENRKEMLEIFITESKKELSLLHEAWLGHDRQGIHAILHKNLPLWETVRLDYPMEKLRKIVMQDPGSWTEKQLEEIHKIKHAAERLVAYAEKIREGNR